ncbi:MAG: 1-phosphofructokinase family hexose kinase [Spirochaetota bacterium]|nr:1-phosphofructokinase family hexose kinase [Spirochaetota bacterium]
MITTITLNPAVDYHISIDVLTQGESLSSSCSEYFAGGKGINVSNVLKNLKKETNAVAFLGGFTGDYIKSLTKDILIPIPIQDTTRINTKLKTLKTETEIHGVAPNISLEEFAQLKQKLQSMNMDYLVLSGSLPKNLPIDSYLQIINTVAPTTQIVLDTRGQALKEAINSPNLFLLKPNKAELSEFFNCKIDTNQDALVYAKKMYQEYDIKFLIISLGSEGAYFLYQDQVYFSKGLEGKLISSVGAGDSMIAGFISKYIDTQDAIESFKYSIACGSGTAFSHDLCTLETANELYNNVIVKLI